MKTDNFWNDFLKSGRIDDYLTFVNSRKENGTSERDCKSFYNRGTGDKGNESGGE
ncbi:MAG: hypothetical protein U0K18_04385 [Acutalibacteraceae bacterium]|nr:hypothetical protein [Clostridia bacterium]MEE1330427.1 hypothetical protein [Acutalibacteraceae bacterium]